jgi:hypothetical protein
MAEREGFAYVPQARKNIFEKQVFKSLFPCDMLPAYLALDRGFENTLFVKLKQPRRTALVWRRERDFRLPSQITK